MNYEVICRKVCDLSIKAGDFIRKERASFSKKDVEQKGLHDLVSYVDKSSEKLIVEELRQMLPEAGFIAEEGTVEQNLQPLNWVIDPLDGTTNFIHSIPCFSVSIALVEENKPVLGVVYEINRNECFYAWNESLAFLNGKEIKVSAENNLGQTLLATGFPYYDYARMDAYLDILKYFMENTRGIRRLGSAATDLAYVACGRFDGFYEYSLSPWDVAAGAFIVQQAGGKVSDFSGGENYIFGKEIIAAGSNIFKEFQHIIQQKMAG